MVCMATFPVQCPKPDQIRVGCAHCLGGLDGMSFSNFTTTSALFTTSSDEGVSNSVPASSIIDSSTLGDPFLWSSGGGKQQSLQIILLFSLIVFSNVILLYKIKN
jgi:hypothetical protein